VLAALGRTLTLGVLLNKDHLAAISFLWKATVHIFQLEPFLISKHLRRFFEV